MTQHLLTLWNPSYADSIMDLHLEVLLRWAEKRQDGEAEEDEVHVWWAKIRSSNRQQKLPHVAEILALQEQIDIGEETHLYLTDYRSLYVAHIDEITQDDVLAEGEGDHAPAYYEGMAADFWFRLTDIRMVIADDTVATIEELKKLQNVRYHGRPVSLYGGMVELPLIVTRADDYHWFSDPDLLTDGQLWAQRDAELRGETERMARELRDNLIGRRLWVILEPTTRNFLASAEAVFRARRDDPRFDFSGPAIEYAKAVETELNALLWPVLKRALRTTAPAQREVHIEGRTLDLGGGIRHQSLGTMKNLLQHNDTARGALRRALPSDASWLVDALPAQLARLADLRNPAAHGERVGREAASDVREEVLGVGGEGVVVRLAGVRGRAG